MRGEASRDETVDSQKGHTEATLRLRVLLTLLAVLSAYVLLAYGVSPAVWRRLMARHPALVDAPSVTLTPEGIRGDPLNIALVGTQDEVVTAMISAGWHPADPITLKSSLKIARTTIFHRPYEDAPVSTLLLWGRRQDLAFEREVGHDPRQRHHVRFWRSDPVDFQGRPMWMGAATFDESVGISHRTGQITHHIGPDLDAERDKIVSDLQAAGCIEDVYFIEDFQQAKMGRNGGGDRYRTDGRLAVAKLRLVPGAAATSAPRGS